ncbi:hypothetical protein M3Y96_00858300 [Aphelenchoides besseyi]|nr:hypothetical protein M3Y96_00858300 [Aphelenchoides besseyi]
MTQSVKIKMVDGEAEFELSENVLSESSIKHAFLLPSDAIVSLYYVVDGRRKYCQTRLASEPSFFLPNDWPNRQFFATSNASSRPGSVMNRDPPRIIDKPSVSPTDEAVPRKRAKIVEQTESNAKDLQWFQSLQQYALFYEGDNKAKRCITPLTKQIAVTYAHGSHQNLTKESTEGTPIIVRCYYNKKYRVEAKVVKKDNALDVIILQAVSENFLEHNPPIGVPEIGTRYLMLGLSNIENRKNPFSLGCGSVTAMLEDQIRFIGSSGCSGGDSGAGLWNSTGALIGMNIMVKQNPLHVKQTADNRQKQFTHAIGGATVFVRAGTIKLFASEYIPAESPIPFEE